MESSTTWPLIEERPRVFEQTRILTSSDTAVTIGKGAAFAAAYGAAMEIGDASGHILGFSLAVPLTFAVSVAVLLPTSFVVLAMQQAPISFSELATAAVRAFRYATFTLGGLAPTLLLLSTSIDDRNVVYQFAMGGIWLAGLIGAYRLFGESRQFLAIDVASRRLRVWATLVGFVWLGLEFADRIWSYALVLIGGAS